MSCEKSNWKKNSNCGLSCTENLMLAIIQQAINDYKKALNQLNNNPYHTGAKHMIDDCEKFFLSQWFLVFCDVDGARVIKHLQNQVKQCV